MKATYLWHGGSDLTVVNAARVSFGKAKEIFDEKDARLLRYLAKHKHELPFAHPHVAFHMKAPIFVARQLAKHQVGFVWSEISRRYVKDTPEVYIPDVLRKGSPDIKQGSLEEEIYEPILQKHNYRDIVNRAVLVYEHLLRAGVCPEQARAVLPQAAYTEWHWTGSLLGWARVWGLRVKPDAQRETRELVEQIDAPLSEHFPAAWQVLKEAMNGSDL